MERVHIIFPLYVSCLRDYIQSSLSHKAFYLSRPHAWEIMYNPISHLKHIILESLMFETVYNLASYTKYITLVCLIFECIQSDLLSKSPFFYKHHIWGIFYNPFFQSILTLQNLCLRNFVFYIWSYLTTLMCLPE